MEANEKSWRTFCESESINLPDWALTFIRSKKKSRPSKAGGLVDNWKNITQSTLLSAKSGGKSTTPSTTSKTRTPTSAGRSNSNSHLGGFPDVEDESQERAVISEGRRTQQVSFHSKLLFFTTNQGLSAPRQGFTSQPYHQITFHQVPCCHCET
jgi:hypothetical protein